MSGAQAAAWPGDDRAADGERVFVHGMVLEARVGVHDHERIHPQPLRISVDLDVRASPGSGGDRLEDVVCYEQIAASVRRLAGHGHVRLVETLAGRIAAHCLEDSRVLRARVRVEKMTAIDGADCAGVEITRSRPDRA